LLMLLFGLKLGFTEYWIQFTARFGGAHAFGNNSTESEPIWMEVVTDMTFMSLLWDAIDTTVVSLIFHTVDTTVVYRPHDRYVP